jgi:hypothetical protein
MLVVDSRRVRLMKMRILTLALIALPYLALFALAVANVRRDGIGSWWTVIVVLELLLLAVTVRRLLKENRSKDVSE